MLQFILGMVAGATLFGEKKESDAEYRKKALEADRRRAFRTLSKDLSKLPPIIEGPVENVEAVRDLNTWAYPFKILTVANTKIAISNDAPVSPGVTIRVVNDSKVRIDGVWHPIISRVTKRDKMIQQLAGLTQLVAAGCMLWSLQRWGAFMWTTITQAWDEGGLVSLSLTETFSQNGPIFEHMQWFVCVAGSAAVVGLLDMIPMGQPGTWRSAEFPTSETNKE